MYSLLGKEGGGEEGIIYYSDKRDYVFRFHDVGYLIFQQMSLKT